MATVLISSKKESFKVCADATNDKMYNNKTLYLVLHEFNLSREINYKISIVVSKAKKGSINYGICGYYGFRIVSILEFKEKAVINLEKVKDIDKNLKPKRYSLFIKLPRTGKNGKRIFVYKLRTMQPYSEYLQDYIVEKNGLNDNGTIKDDFRITKAGKIFRKYWLDELPMLLNWFKGDLKLIGIRPLSDTMLSTYPQEYVEERNKYKPGLIPPYYIDQPKTFDGIIESEKRYIKLYKNSGWHTDIKYFLKFLKVLFFKGVRSS